MTPNHPFQALCCLLIAAALNLATVSLPEAQGQASGQRNDQGGGWTGRVVQVGAAQRIRRADQQIRAASPAPARRTIGPPKLDRHLSWGPQAQGTGLSLMNDLHVQANFGADLGDYTTLRDDIEGVTGFATLRYDLPLAGAIRPYVKGGLGMGRFQTEAIDQVAFGAQGAIGIDIALAERTSLFAEVRHARFFKLDSRLHAGPADSDASMTVAQIGLTRRF